MQRRRKEARSSQDIYLSFMAAIQFMFRVRRAWAYTVQKMSCMEGRGTL